MATFEDFQKIDIRIGKIIQVEDFPDAKKPSYKLTINLGKEIGIKKSCAQLVKNYTKSDLKNKLVLCVVNLPPRQIGSALSEVLTLGIPDSEDNCILIQPEQEINLGVRLY
ncbi:MAG: tRNA-binding protein [Nanoarchaeota archaeon]